MKIGFIIPWSDSYLNKMFWDDYSIYLQGIKPMGLRATLANYKPNNSSQTKIVTKNRSLSLYNWPLCY